MGFAGDYKLYQMMGYDPEKGMVYVDLETYEKQFVEEGDEVEFERNKNTELHVCEDGNMLMTMAIPEGAPEEEIKKAEAAGRIVDGRFVVDRIEGKIEDGNIYMHDPSKMMTGEEWIKVNTDNEGEINLLSVIYRKK